MHLRKMQTGTFKIYAFYSKLYLNEKRSTGKNNKIMAITTTENWVYFVFGLFADWLKTQCDMKNPLHF